MALFRNRPLGVLSKIYSFAQGLTGMSDFSLEGSIQPVHNLSREAELGAKGDGHAGIWIMGSRVTANGAVVYTNAIDPYALVGGQGYDPDPSEDWIWLLDCFCSYTGTGTPGRASCLIDSGASPSDLYAGQESGSSLLGDRMFAYWTAFAMGVALADSDGYVRPPSFQPIPYGDGLRFGGEETGGVNDTVFTWSSLLWLGKQGVMPPGMA